jgi:hypothetical protein
MAKKGAERHFTIQGSDIGFVGGNYKADSPYRAAKKAARALFKKAESEAKFARYKNTKTIKFLLRETTQTSEKKSFYYDGSIVKIEPPKVIVRKGVEISISREIKIKTCRDPVTIKTPSA